MKEVIEIYIKIIIATFSFIAPSMMFFLGIFAKGSARQRKRNTEIIESVKKQILNPSISDEGNDDDKISDKEKNIKNLKKLQKKAERDNNLLKPKRQVLRIFLPLILSAIFVSCYYICKCSHFPRQGEVIYFKLVSLILSVLAFSYALFSIGQVYFVMESLKQMEFDDEELAKMVKESNIEKFEQIESLGIAESKENGKI